MLIISFSEKAPAWAYILSGIQSVKNYSCNYLMDPLSSPDVELYICTRATYKNLLFLWNIHANCKL